MTLRLVVSKTALYEPRSWPPEHFHPLTGDPEQRLRSSVVLDEWDMTRPCPCLDYHDGKVVWPKFCTACGRRSDQEPGFTHGAPVGSYENVTLGEMRSYRPQNVPHFFPLAVAGSVHIVDRRNVLRGCAAFGCDRSLPHQASGLYGPRYLHVAPDLFDSLSGVGPVAFVSEIGELLK